VGLDRTIGDQCLRPRSPIRCRQCLGVDGYYLTFEGGVEPRVDGGLRELTGLAEVSGDEARGLPTVNIITPSPSSSFSSPSFIRRTGGFVGDSGFIK